MASSSIKIDKLFDPAIDTLISSVEMGHLDVRSLNESDCSYPWLSGFLAGNKSAASSLFENYIIYKNSHIKSPSIRVLGLNYIPTNDTEEFIDCPETFLYFLINSANVGSGFERPNPYILSGFYDYDESNDSKDSKAYLIGVPEIKCMGKNQDVPYAIEYDVFIVFLRRKEKTGKVLNNEFLLCVAWPDEKNEDNRTGTVYYSMNAETYHGQVTDSIKVQCKPLVKEALSSMITRISDPMDVKWNPELFDAAATQRVSVEKGLFLAYASTKNIRPSSILAITNDKCERFVRYVLSSATVPEITNQGGVENPFNVRRGWLDKDRLARLQDAIDDAKSLLAVT